MVIYIHGSCEIMKLDQFLTIGFLTVRRGAWNVKSFFYCVWFWKLGIESGVYEMTVDRFIDLDGCQFHWL